MADETHVGITATLAMSDAAEVIAEEVARVAKDGISIADGPALLAHLATNGDAQVKLYAAYQAAKNIGAEVRDLDETEKRTLIHRGVDMGFNIFEALTGTAG